MKARDIIPGWPRGRSTSRPIELESPPSMFGGAEVGSVLDYSATETVFGVDHRWKQDWAAKEFERRRKADMMEAFWLTQMADVEKQKPRCCPNCGNDGRSKHRLTVLELHGMWSLRCLCCRQTFIQDFQGISHLFSREQWFEDIERIQTALDFSLDSFQWRWPR